MRAEFALSIALLACSPGGESGGSCGNGVLEQGEACDGVEFGGVTCRDFGYLRGPLQCASDCSEARAIQCTDAEIGARTAICGNGFPETGEDCDTVIRAGEASHCPGGTGECTPQCAVRCAPDPCAGVECPSQCRGDDVLVGACRGGRCVEAGRVDCPNACANGECVNAQGECDPQPEVCNGGDEDCDRRVDEGVENACGACGAVPREICNARDDDCDGDTDEGLSCDDCRPAEEVCNQRDDDCDERVDEGLECGGCEDSHERCDGDDDDCDGRVDEGVQNACGGCGAVPRETCNGDDDDCDGATDEGVRNACGGCGDVPRETCNGDDDDCDGDTDEGVSNACGGCGARVPVERCDGEDNDCDGETDEGELCGDDVCDGEEGCLGLACGNPPNRLRGGRLDGPSLSWGSCGGARGSEAVTEFRAPSAGTYVMIAGGIDTVLYVRSDCDDPDSEIACDDDGGEGNSSRLELELRAGQTVFIIIDSFGAAGGEWTLSVERQCVERCLVTPGRTWISADPDLAITALGTQIGCLVTLRVTKPDRETSFASPGRMLALDSERSIVASADYEAGADEVWLAMDLEELELDGEMGIEVVAASEGVRCDGAANFRNVGCYHAERDGNIAPALCPGDFCVERSCE